MSEPAVVVPDQMLLWDMRQGSPEAAGELRRRHAKSLYALAYGVVWDSDLADSVVQQAFEQAERSAHGFRASGGSVFRWLSTITRTHAERAAKGSAAWRPQSSAAT